MKSPFGFGNLFGIPPLRFPCLPGPARVRLERLGWYTRSWLAGGRSRLDLNTEVPVLKRDALSASHIELTGQTTINPC
jgi:hypothetical protein